MKANSTSYFGCSVLQSQKPISQRRTNMSEKNTPTEDPKAKNDTPATQHEEPVAPAQETNEIQEQPIDDTEAIAGQSGDSVLTGINENDPGDIIIAIKKDNLEFKVKSFSGLVNFLNENTIPGDVIKLTVIRGNENLNLDVKLGFRPLIN